MKKNFEKLILGWLKFLAKIQLRKNKPIVIGVTGSAGKTSAVKAIGLALNTTHPTKYSKKGNSQTGLPLEILGIPVKNYQGIDWLVVCLTALWQILTTQPKYKYLVLEMGIDGDQPPSNMDYLLSIVRPQIGVLLNINQVHGQNFSSQNTLQAIADEKGKLLTSLPPDGLAVYSSDYDLIEQLSSKIKSQKKKFSLYQRANYQLLKYELSLTGTKFVFLAEKEQHQLNFKNQLFPKSTFGSFASALIIAQHFKVPLKTAILELETNYFSPPGRMSLIGGLNQSFIIDSSYNSSLEPALSALEMLSLIQVRGKKIAILGDMREIGPGEKDDHQALAKKASQVADEIVLVGPLTKKYILPKLKKLKYSSSKIYHFPTSWSAIKKVKEIIEPHDLILVKGSQNTIFLETITQAIMADPNKAKKLLPRQSKYWEKQRKKYQDV